MTIGAEMALFFEALEHEGGERMGFVESIEDAALRARVRALLLSHEEAEAEGDGTWRATDGTARVALDLTGHTVGRYAVQERIAQGGMGVVYEARQDTPHRTVALKVLHAEASPETIRRFQHEAEILGSLEHPGIARVYDAGAAPTTAGALPYLAMERIQGQPIDEWVKTRALDVRGKLALVAAVCDAVAHAHLRGVIHRDLKPGNVLVDEHGQPKVLDFGIARVRDKSATVSLQTQAGQILGTLPYMSPEQVGGDPDAVDTRSDVYALGVLAFELLAGRLPIAVGDRPLLEAARVIREEEPPLLGALEATLRGDVETVVAKALAKDPARRYATASDLAADVRRILDHEPIVARPASAIYQLKKLVRRHRAWFAGTAAVLVALVTGLVLALVERDRARAAESTANAAKQQAQADAARARSKARSLRGAVQFLHNVLLMAAPHAQRGDGFDMQERLRSVSESLRLDREPPDVAALLEVTLATFWKGAGDYERAQRHIDRAKERFPDATLVEDFDRAWLHYVEGSLLNARGEHAAAASAFALARDLLQGYELPEERVLTARVAIAQAAVESHVGSPAAAVELAREAVKIALESSGNASELHAQSVGHLGVALGKASRWREAQEALERAVALHQSDSNVFERAQAIANLAWATYLNGSYESAIARYGVAIPLFRSLHDGPNAGLANALLRLADVHWNCNQLAEAEASYAEALDHLRRLHDRDHGDTAWAEAQLGLVRAQLGKHEEGIALTRKAIGRYKRLRRGRHPNYARSIQNLSRAYTAAGKKTEAIKYARSAVRASRRIHGAGHHRVAIQMVTLAMALIEVEELDEAERTTRDLLKIQFAHHGRDHHGVAQNRRLLARILAAAGRIDEAEKILLEVDTLLLKKLDAKHPKRDHAARDLIALYDRTGRKADADRLRARIGK